MSRAEIVYVPPSLRRGRQGGRGSGARGPDHAAFEYDVVEAVRPRLLVDVGAGNGGSFFSLCDAARDHELDCTFYAVEAFAASADPGADRDAFQTRIHDDYRGFAYLLAAKEGDTRRHFEPGSLGVLRLDAATSGAPLEELLDAWLSRVAPGGVVLCANLSREGDEARFLRRTSDDALVFPFGDKLGVWVVPGGAAPSAPLVGLLAGGPGAREDLVRFYEYASRHLWLEREIAAAGAVRPGKKSA